MNISKKITIRSATISDLDSLIKFYLKAYGENTIFQEKTFLLHYFKSFDKRKEIFGNIFIAINEDGLIISHYGGLSYNLISDNIVYPFIWSVSAFTLPECRGNSLNSSIVNIVLRENYILGGIGVSQKTALFYNSIGYNTFEFKRFSRYILNVHPEQTSELIKLINPELIFQVNSISPKVYSNSEKDVIELNHKNFNNYSIQLHNDSFEITTTYRDLDFIKWRFLEYPYLSYRLYAYIENNRIISYTAIRILEIGEEKRRIIRIIDLFGNIIGVEKILLHLGRMALNKNVSYIDFVVFGDLYKEILNQLGFIMFSDDEFCIFPQVFDPIENRPNNEYIIFYSEKENELISKLTKDNIYFTLMDADRDRIGRIKKN